MNDIILSGLISLATGAIGYFFGGKKRADADIKQTLATVHSTELDAIDKAVEIWRKLAQDLKKELDEVRALVAVLRVENDKLTAKVDELERQALIKS